MAADRIVWSRICMMFVQAREEVTHVWKYVTPIGTLFIKRLDDGRYGFEKDGVLWDVCETPEAMLDSICHHFTGCAEWDASEIEVPVDLDKWVRL